MFGGLFSFVLLGFCKMKKLPRFFAVSFFSLLLCAVTNSILSCADINTDAYVFQSTSSLVSGGTKDVRLVVSSNANLLSVRASRTIAPAAYDSELLNFYLGGKNVGTGENLAIQKVEFVANANSTNSGTITVPLNSYNYQLVLLAIPKETEVSLTSNTYVSNIASLAVLAGSSTADLRYSGDSAVNFYLSSEGLTGLGGYSIDFYLKDWSSASLAAKDENNSGLLVVSNVSISLRTLVGDSTVSGTSVTGKRFTSATSESTAISYEKDSVMPGTYYLCVSFSYGDKSFVYSDKIIILPYQTTTATIGIPDILQNIPAAPTEFAQGYAVPENEESDYYRVIFSWEDNSNTETGFEIQFLDVTDFTTITTETENSEETWNSISSEQITSYSTEFDGSSSWYAGSLARNSTAAVFYMPLGKRYLARIRSVNNDIGASPWCYASSEAVSISIPAGTSTATNLYLSYAETVTGKAFDTAIINLFRVTYNLVGGTISPAIATTYYFDQIAGGAPILTPDGYSRNGTAVYGKKAISLSNGSLDWSGWAIESVDGEKYPFAFTKCTSESVYDASTTYYIDRKRTDEGLSEKDINGNEYTYVALTPQPTEFDDYTGFYVNYWTTEGILANYIGYKNLSLYAIYTDDESGTESTDYSIKENLSISVFADGSSRTIENYSFTAPSTTANFTLTYRYVTETFTYDSISLTLTENGGSEIGNYTPTSNAFSFSPANLSKGFYTLTIKATKLGSEFRTSLIMILE